MIQIPVQKRKKAKRDTVLEGWTSIAMSREGHERLKILSAKSGMSMRKIIDLLIKNAEVAK